MPSNTYFGHYVIHYVAKLKVYDIDYRRDGSLCMKLWKETIKKKTMREKNVK